MRDLFTGQAGTYVLWSVISTQSIQQNTTVSWPTPAEIQMRGSFRSGASRFVRTAPYRIQAFGRGSGIAEAAAEP